jgi:hypothetical protein
MARQGLAQIAKETDPARLREGIAQLEAAAAQLPPQAKPAVDLVRRRALERLAALEKESK